MPPIAPHRTLPKPGPQWLLAPGERSPEFFPAFARISVALQQTLRDLVPTEYFAHLESYRDPRKAYPMLLYQASRPFRARTRTELTYDVLNPAALARVYRSAKQTLPDLLVAAEQRLLAAGCEPVARHYQPRRTVEIIDTVQRLSKSRRCLYVLIRSESLLLNALIDLGGLGALPPKAQRRRISDFEKQWRFQLRRLYPGSDFLHLAQPLMDAVTRALVEFQSLAPGSADPGTT